MARQMLKQKYAEDLLISEEIKQDKSEYNPQKDRILGCKYLTANAFNRDIFPTNKYQKVCKITKTKLSDQVDKQKIKQTVASLRNMNQKILAKNGIKEQVDDFIYLHVTMAKGIREKNGVF
jgi:hypothetical protein